MAAVSLELEAGLALITLGRGREGNRLGPELLGELNQALKTASDNPRVRVMLLRSNTKTFCLGMDLQALQKANWQQEAISQSIQLYLEALKRIYFSGKPVVATIQGDVKAGGVGLAAACDYILGTEEASFEMAEVFFGLIPANVLPVLQGFRISPGSCRALVLAAKKILAEEALRLGLLDELAPALNLEKRLKELLKRLMTLAPLALAEAKRLTYELAGRDLNQMFLQTSATLQNLLLSEEVQQGITLSLIHI